jgi:hypothetical protein
MPHLQLVGDTRSKVNTHQRAIRPILTILPKRAPFGIFPSIGRLIVLAMLLLVAIDATSCIVVDHFSHRAVQYNREAEQVQDQDLLLNIVRASKRRPLEFAGLQTVSGTGQSSGGASLSWPLRLNNATAATTLNPTAMFSGGPTFAVGVLDTQDFFGGILNPIPLDTLDMYYQERYSSTMLFNLLIAQIVIKQTDSVTGQMKVLEIPNNVGRDSDVDRFQTIIDYLLNMGLNTDSKPSVTTFGKLLTPDQAGNLADLSRAATAGLDVKEVPRCDLTDAQLRTVLSKYGGPAEIETQLHQIKAICEKLANGEKPDDREILTLSANLPGDLPQVFYRAQKSSKHFQLCFERPPENELNVLDPVSQKIANSIYSSSVSCGEPKKKVLSSSDLNVAAAPISTGQSPQLGFKGLTLGPELAQKLNALESSGWYQIETENLNAGTPTIPFPPLNSNCTKVCTLVFDKATKTQILNPDCVSQKCSQYGEIDFTRSVQIDFSPRSTEGIIYYLGEIVRREEGPDVQNNLEPPKRTIMIKYNPALRKAIPNTICLTPPTDKKPDLVPVANGYRCEPIFVLNRVHPITAPILGVTYEATGYQVPAAQFAYGRSPQVLDITLQLTGLFKSAKNLPTTSVFTLISPP